MARHAAADPGRGGLARLMASAMFHYDEAMTDLVIAACRERLSMDPVALDFGGLVESLDAELAGLMPPRGPTRPRSWNASSTSCRPRWSRATARASCRSFPAAPTKASLLFDMFVSCSSLHGTSWLEAAGVVVAENQALAVLAAQAGLPDDAGGLLRGGSVSGQPVGPLRGRDTAGHRRQANPPIRPLIALSEDAHSSMGKALHVLGVGTLTVATEDHR